MTEREKLLQDALYNLGITRKSKGYEVITAAVFKVMDDPDMLLGVTKILYFDLAKETNSSYTRIEKTLRDASKKAWEKNPEYLKRITHLDLTKKPSSTEFIDMLAVYVERELNETEKVTI